MPSERSSRPGAFVSFPYDRELVRRFRDSFPRARWQEEGHWFVPGSTAAKRVGAWIDRELAALDRYADLRGRDAFLFDPLESDYLTVGEDFAVRTPYSRTVVQHMRAIPWARWDPDERLWRIPFRSYEALRRCWPEVEAAARRNEPEARKARRAEAPAPDEAEKRRRAERRRRRYPVPGDDLPPFDTPVATGFGVVMFEDVEDAPVDAGAAAAFPYVGDAPERHVWARWRMPSFRELRALKPAPAPVPAAEAGAARGWWPASAEEIEARLATLRRRNGRRPA